MGLPVQNAGQCAQYRREEQGRRQEEEEQHVSPGDVEAVGVAEGKLWFLLYPLAGRGEQALLPLVLISFSFIPTSALI